MKRSALVNYFATMYFLLAYLSSLSPCPVLMIVLPQPPTFKFIYHAILQEASVIINRSSQLHHKDGSDLLNQLTACILRLGKQHHNCGACV